MSNISIIDKISERQNRMQEKYFSKHQQFQSTQNSSSGAVSGKKMQMAQRSTQGTIQIDSRGPPFSVATKSISGYSHSTGTKFNFKNKKISSPQRLNAEENDKVF